MEYSEDAIFFLEGHVYQVLRCLKTTSHPQSLSITTCQLSDSDMNHLSHCPNTSQLKQLDGRGIKLINLSAESIQILLEKIVATLKTLDEKSCEITDSQLHAILSALSCCSQLRSFRFYGNFISMSVLKYLLCHTARRVN